MKRSPTHPAPDGALGVQRAATVLQPDHSRVLFRPFPPGGPARLRELISQLEGLTEEQVSQKLQEVFDEFGERHLRIESLLERNCHHYLPAAGERPDWSRERMLLFGAYCTSEYALESAALFNPSIVPHPEQDNLPAGALRFILSLRATGEGHVSSIEFREGILHPDLQIEMVPASGFVSEPERIAEHSYDGPLFRLKLSEMGFDNGPAQEVLNPLGDRFTRQCLEEQIRQVRESHPSVTHEAHRTHEAILWLADSNYEVRFAHSQPIADRIIFPSSQSHKNGLEDARFVLFRHDDGSCCYYATFTAFEGSDFLPQFITTEDFLRFKINTLNGSAVQDKGLALFPRLIDGKYAMLSRQDQKSIYIMFSDNLHFWQEAELLLTPRYDWEFVKIGNCGSPIETEAGWLVITHGVGPMRRYCLGAILLDRHDPRKVIGRLPHPLLKPDENEREGYVPNVVYSCGALLYQEQLVIPYGMSDYASGFATVPVKDVLHAMV